MASTKQRFLAKGIFSVVITIAVTSGVRADTSHALAPRASDVSLIKKACTEWSRTPRQPTTSAELTKWLRAAQIATKRALSPATQAAKKNPRWNTFVGNLVILQANMDSLQRKRQFADAKLWDYAVMYLKSTCTRMLK